jgi:hypothetical protein
VDPNRLERRTGDDTAVKEATMLRLLALALVPLALTTSAALGAKGGPAPGVLTGWDGAVDGTGAVRFVALPNAKTTAVAAVRTSDGRVLRYGTIRGGFGVPVVAFDGTTEGVSWDGRTLVLAGVGTSATETRFSVLPTSTLRLAKAITLSGRWSFDALSPDGRMLYAIQYLNAGTNPRYAVRSVSLVTGKPVGGAIVDRREPDEEMNGSPWARVRSANGAWAYTLYANPNGSSFVHALDTVRRRAFCIDLPWRSSLEAISAVRLSLAEGGRRLVLSTPRAGRLAVVDTGSWQVSSFRKP